MPVQNADIAALFYRLADLLEIEGANPFRIRAYRNAARTLEELPKNVAALIGEEQDLAELPGIGEDLAGKIAEVAQTGRLKALEETERRVPKSLAALVALPGLGPKRVKLLHEKLKIRSLEDLERALRAGRLRKLAGFGIKTEEKIARALAHERGAEKRLRLAEAEPVARSLLAYIEGIRGVSQAIVAGSYRRRRETVGDLDILVAAADGAGVMDEVVAFEDVADIVAKGETRATVHLKNAIQVDVRVVPKESYGAALHYFTGSKAHNIAVRRLGVAKGLKINEYGVFNGKRRVGGRTEAEVFKAVGLPFIPPELREDRGEIEAARKNALPRLVEAADIRGDLHVHTTASDGRNSIEQMVEAAQARGYAYLAISDHTRHLTVAHGLDARRLARQIEAIDKLDARLENFRVLKSAEVDILADGSLDLPDSILKELDFTVCSVHYRFDLPARQQTERILKAMDNRYFTILGHPSGRLIGRREPYALELERLIEGARERGCFLEVNGQPDRLDLNDVACKMAKEAGVMVSIATDAHSVAQLDYMRYGLDQARRGWLEPARVLNTRPWPQLAKLLARS